MTSALPLRTNIYDTATDYGCEYTIERVGDSDDFGIYYLVELRQYLVDVHINETILKELFIPALCARNGNRVIAKNSKCAGEFDEILTMFMSKAVMYQMCASRNENLVNIDQPFFANGTVYYSRPYYEGQLLSQYVGQRGRLSFEEVERLVKPICEAVAMLHDKMFVHYAISPYNIRITTDSKVERAVLMDFGRAVQGIGPRKVLAYPTLTPYLPKEQYTGTPSFECSSDVYALAATVCYCLTGHDPAYAEELNLDKMCDELLTLGIEAERVNVLLRGLEPSRFKRYGNARKFTEALFAPLAEDSESADAPEAFAPQESPTPTAYGAFVGSFDDSHSTKPMTPPKPEPPAPQAAPQPTPQPADEGITHAVRRRKSYQPPMPAAAAPAPTPCVYGMPPAGAPAPAPAQAKASHHKRWIIPVIVAIVIALAVISWFVFFGPGHSEQAEMEDTPVVEIQEPVTVPADTVAADTVAAPAEVAASQQAAGSYAPTPTPNAGVPAKPTAPNYPSSPAPQPSKATAPTAIPSGARPAARPAEDPSPMSDI